jgi:hypothetical protein
MVTETVLDLKILDLDKVLLVALEQGYRCSFPSLGEHMRLIDETGGTLIVDFDQRARLYGGLALAGHLLDAGAAT